MLEVWDGVGQVKKQGGEEGWSRHRDQRGRRSSREADHCLFQGGRDVGPGWDSA